jgi:hypothetical protein
MDTYSTVLYRQLRSESRALGNGSSQRRDSIGEARGLQDRRVQVEDLAA